MKERFESKILKTNTCWLWQGSITPKGYGRFRLGSEMAKAHRVAYELYKGPIPDGLCVCHTCDVRHCVNPDHLWLGTNKENTQDKMNKGRHYAGKRNQRIFEDDMLKIKDLIKQGIKQRDIAQLYNISQQSVSRLNLK